MKKIKNLVTILEVQCKSKYQADGYLALKATSIKTLAYYIDYPN